MPAGKGHIGPNTGHRDNRLIVVTELVEHHTAPEEFFHSGIYRAEINRQRDKPAHVKAAFIHAKQRQTSVYEIVAKETIGIESAERKGDSGSGQDAQLAPGRHIEMLAPMLLVVDDGWQKADAVIEKERPEDTMEMMQAKADADPGHKRPEKDNYLAFLDLDRLFLLNRIHIRYLVFHCDQSASSLFH